MPRESSRSPRTLEFSLPPPGSDRLPPDAGDIRFIGTATTVIRLGPFTLLTDPNFLHAGDHAHLGYGLTSRRLTDPALEPEDLPPLDGCVLSHLHGDHWDHVAEEKLSKDLLVLTPPPAARTLQRRGFGNATGLDRWDTAVLRRGSDWLRITATPARHGPPLVSAFLPDVMGSLWEFGVAGARRRFRLWISGDTLVHDDLRHIPARYPGIDLALLHLGGTRVLGVLVTMDAAQGIEAIRIVGPRVTIPIHFDDYPVFKSPLADFTRAVADAGLAHRIKVLARGESYAFTVRGEAERLDDRWERARGPAAPRIGPAATPPGPPFRGE